MKTFYTKKDGRIDQVAQTSNDKRPLYGSGWKTVPNDWNGSHGDKLEWFDASMHRIPDSELVKQGKRIDNIGLVYNKRDRSSRHIYLLDEALFEDETKIAPIENEIFQDWSESEQKWVIDTERKERAEKEKRLEELKGHIDDAERKIIRPMRAIQGQRATEADLKIYNELDIYIESLRPEITQLEEELKNE